LFNPTIPAAHESALFFGNTSGYFIQKKKGEEMDSSSPLHDDR